MNKDTNRSIINSYPESTNLTVGHYGNEVLSHDKREVTSSDWHAFRLHFIVRGGILFRYGNQTVDFGAHTFFLLRPDADVSYLPAPDRQTEIYWVTFTGSSAATFCDTMQLTAKMPFLHIPNEYAARTRRIFAEAFNEKVASSDPFMRNLLFLKNLLRLFEIIYDVLPHTARSELTQAEKSRFRIALDFVHKNYTDPSVNLSLTAQTLNLNANYLSRLFRRHMSLTFTQYLTQLRIEHAASLFQQGAASVSQVAYQSGFNDPLYFSKIFKKLNGASPSDCIKNNRS